MVHPPDGTARDEDLTGLVPFDPLTVPTADGLRALARAASALAGRVHGDLRPGTVWIGEGRVAFSAGELLATRLRAGAAPVEVAWTAPEVVAGATATPASDVYSLGALCFGLLARRPPLGMLDAGRVATGQAGPLAFVLGRALAYEPAARPTLEEVADALGKAADAAAPVGTPDEDDDDDGALGGLVKREKERPAQLSALLVLLLILGGAFVLFGALVFVAISWTWLPEGARLVMLLGLNGGIYGGGRLLELRGFQRSGFALVVLASQLLWADATYLLNLTDLLDEPGPWAACGAVITAAGFWLAVSRRSALMATLAAGALIVATSTLGAAISTGSDTGPPVWLLLTCAAHGAAAWLGQRLVGPPVGVPFALVGGLVGTLSGLWGLGLLADDEVAFGTVWPYLVGGAGLLVAWGTRGAYRWCAAVPGISLLLLAPTVSALIQYDAIGYLYAAIALGLFSIAAAFKHEPLAAREGPQLLAILVGLLNATVGPALLCLVKCADEDGADLLEEALASLGRVHETEFVYLAMVLGISAGLVGLGVVFAPLAKNKLPYRLLEAAGVSLFLFVLTLLSLIQNDDLVYPALLFLCGGAVLALGVYQRRAAMATLATVGLILNLWIQYFARLSEAVPVSLLCIGFGLGLLGSGVLYERKVKHLLPRLKEWK